MTTNVATKTIWTTAAKATTTARTAATDSRMLAAADERPVLFVLPIGLPVAGKRKDLSLAVRAGDDASVLARDFVAQVLYNFAVPIF